MKQEKIQPQADQTGFRGFMYEHGRATANVLSLSRIPLALLTRHYIREEKYGRALVVYSISGITDKADGMASEMSKQGKTKFGGRLDELCDKAAAIIVEEALVEKGLLDPVDFAVRTTRDVLMTAHQRPKYEKQGISTSAVLSGKGSTTGIIVANGFAMTPIAREHHTARQTVNHTATGGKVYSFFDSPRGWKKRHEQKLQAEAQAVVYEAA